MNVSLRSRFPHSSFLVFIIACCIAGSKFHHLPLFRPCLGWAYGSFLWSQMADHCWMWSLFQGSDLTLNKKKVPYVFWRIWHSYHLTSYHPPAIFGGYPRPLTIWHCSCYICGCLHPSDIIPQPWDSKKGAFWLVITIYSTCFFLWIPDFKWFATSL